MNFALEWDEVRNFKYEKNMKKKNNKNNMLASAPKPPSTPFT